MTVNAVIAEYNPLHKGHEYLINMGKEITGADYTVVVMSGNYVQRGEPAIMDKSLRTEAALLSGADLVLELPVYYSTASAEYFAKGAVALIEKLGIVDNLVFGCEYDNVDLLKEIALLSLENEMEYLKLISGYMADGASYPKAESLAVLNIVSSSISDDSSTPYPLLASYSRAELSDILSAPNSTLAICYIKALISLNSDIVPVAVKRVLSPHDDYSLGALSSSAVRKELYEANYSPLKDQLSEGVYELMSANIDATYPIFPDDFSELLIYKLRSVIYGNGVRIKAKGILALTEYLDVSDELAGRIIACINEYKSFTQFVALLKTKSVTYSHISRALIHIVLDIKKSNFQKYIANDYSLYARILGFRKESSDVLSEMKKSSLVPIVSKLADADEILDTQLTLKLLNESINASELYYNIVSSRLDAEFISEYTQNIVII